MKENRKPICDYCGIDSPVEYVESVGVTAFHLLKSGWVFKNAILFTGKNTPLCFCSRDCQKLYYSETLKISEKQSKEVKGLVDECKSNFKKDIPKIAEKMAKFRDALIKLKKG